MTAELLNIKLTDIDLENRARQEYDLNDDFLDSIREKGIVQPITVRPEGGRFKVIAGGRRFSGANTVGLATIPCLVRRGGDHLDSVEIEYLENAQRKDLTWQERMVLVRNIHKLMVEKHGEKGSKSATARFLDKSVGGVHRVLALADSVSKFPNLLQCATEDEAVRKIRKLLEGALVTQLAKKHTADAKAAGVTTSSVSEILEKPLVETTETQREDSYIRIALNAASHYRIGDCFEGMQEMIDNDLRPPIQMVEVDPPYGIDLQEQKKGDSSRELDIYEEVPKEKYVAFTNELVSRIDAVTPKNTRIIYWFAQEWYETVVSAFRTVEWNYDPIPCIWNKGSGQTNAPDLYLARTYETFLVATKGEGIPIVERGRSNVFSYAPVPHSRKYHPTQKPLELMDEIFRVFGWAGGIVLCPFLGSGVTLRSAYRKGMIPFGWELNQENKPKLLAAVQEDIEAYKMNKKNGDDPDPSIPF